MLRNAVIKKYVNTKDIQRIIGHSSVVYIKEAFWIILGVAFLYIIFSLLNHTTPSPHWKRIFWGIGLALFAKRVIDFLNSYLDCLILSEEGVTLFLWEGLLQYKTENFSWNKITTISHNQSGFWDKFFAKGDILIKLEFDTEFPFSDVPSPKKQVGKLTVMKEAFLTKQQQTVEHDLSEDNQRFTVLIEAMSEVVKEYMERKQG